MPIPNPWTEADEPAEAVESESNWARERERDRAGAREYRSDEEQSSPDNLVRFPGATTEVVQRSRPGAVSKLGDAAKTWGREARETSTAAIDGSVWRARPPALRDMHVRVQRADWAAGIKPLYVAGLVFGYLSLLVTAVGYGLLWVARRPARLLLATAITVLIVVLAI